VSKVGEAELQRLAKEARDEDLRPPDREKLIASWRAGGWPGEVEPLHRLLLWYEAHAEMFGEEYVAGAQGPFVPWPSGWGSWSLASHRAAIRRHRERLSGVEKIESWYRSLAGG
jgi:hypothetical protein